MHVSSVIRGQVIAIGGMGVGGSSLAAESADGTGGEPFYCATESLQFSRSELAAAHVLLNKSLPDAMVSRIIYGPTGAGDDNSVAAARAAKMKSGSDAALGLTAGDMCRMLCDRFAISMPEYGRCTRRVGLCIVYGLVTHMGLDTNSECITFNGMGPSGHGSHSVNQRITPLHYALWKGARPIILGLLALPLHAGGVHALDRPPTVSAVPAAVKASVAAVAQDAHAIDAKANLPDKAPPRRRKHSHDAANYESDDDSEYTRELKAREEHWVASRPYALDMALTWMERGAGGGEGTMGYNGFANRKVGASVYDPNPNTSLLLDIIARSDPNTNVSRYGVDAYGRGVVVPVGNAALNYCRPLEYEAGQEVLGVAPCLHNGLGCGPVTRCLWAMNMRPSLMSAGAHELLRRACGDADGVDLTTSHRERNIRVKFEAFASSYQAAMTNIVQSPLHALLRPLRVAFDEAVLRCVAYPAELDAALQGSAFGTAVGVNVLRAIVCGYLVPARALP